MPNRPCGGSPEEKQAFLLSANLSTRHFAVRDLRDRPLLERKSLLRKLLPRHPKSVLYVEHVSNGADLFRVICERDMEGIVAKQASATYTPEATTWVKIKNRQYSQAVGREDFFSPKAP